MTPVPALQRATEALLRRPDAVTVVDGRSGSGKTTFAAALAARTGAFRLRMEELYPGWDGLAAGSDALATLLRARAVGAPASAPTWDWIAGRPGPPLRLPAAGRLVVEGCGALTRRTTAFADLRVWVELPEDERRVRALDRDGAVLAPHWERWARQERACIAAQEPRAAADLVIDGRWFPPQVFSDRTGDAHYPRRP